LALPFTLATFAAVFGAGRFATARAGAFALVTFAFAAGRDLALADFTGAVFTREALFALTGFALAFFALDFAALDCLAMGLGSAVQCSVKNRKLYFKSAPDSLTGSDTKCLLQKAILRLIFGSQTLLPGFLQQRRNPRPADPVQRLAPGPGKLRLKLRRLQ